MNILMIIVGILGYVFLARVVENIMLIKDENGCHDRIIPTMKSRHTDYYSGFYYVFVIPLLVLYILIPICKLPIKAADFATNPSNYKFRIRVERK